MSDLQWWIVSVLIGLSVATGVLVAVAGCQFLVLFYLQRFRRSIRYPDPVFYLAESPETSVLREVFVHCRQDFRLRLRCALDLGRVVWQSEMHGPIVQRSSFDHWKGCAWEAPFFLPQCDLQPGAYLVELLVGAESTPSFQTPLLVADPEAELLVVCSTHTWHAYEPFGGLSNYDLSAIPLPLRPIMKVLTATNLRFRLSDRIWVPAIPLPRRRPLTKVSRDLAGLDQTSHLFRAELALIRLLNAQSVRHSVVPHEAFDEIGFDPSHTRLVIFCAHSEYWTRAGIATLEWCTQKGINVAFLSGNNLYRKVEQTPNGLQVINQRIPATLAARLSGSAYDAQGYGTYAGYRVIDRSHWLLEDTSATVTHVMGRPNSETGCRGASGHETDKLMPGHVSGVELVAIGENERGPSCLTCKKGPAGGFIVSTGSVAFCDAIGKDDDIDQLVINLVNKAGVSFIEGDKLSEALSALAGPVGQRQPTAV